MGEWVGIHTGEVVSSSRVRRGFGGVLMGLERFELGSLDRLVDWRWGDDDALDFRMDASGRGEDDDGDSDGDNVGDGDDGDSGVCFLATDCNDDDDEGVGRTGGSFPGSSPCPSENRMMLSSSCSSIPSPARQVETTDDDARLSAPPPAVSVVVPSYVP